MNAIKWYYAQADKTFGPFETPTLRQLATAGVITSETLVAKEGSSEWRALSQVELEADLEGANASLFSGIAGKVSQASGLERLEGFSLANLFSQVFKRHTPEEIEEHFVAGTRATTPALSEVKTGWPTPWAFLRLLGLSIVVSLGFYYAIDRFDNIKLIPGWIFVGCFGIPFTVLVFFMEVNVLRNVSFYRIMSLMFLGGLLSMVLSLFLFEFTGLSRWMGAMSAGIVEEAGKLLAVVYFTRKWSPYGWTLNGLLFGAAVGTGFSAFESAGYVFVALSEGGSSGTNTMILRALFSPFTHSLWTAAAAAAFWRVKGDKAFEWSMLVNFRFLRVFVMVASLHLIWNSPLTLPMVGEILGFFGSRVTLGLVGWMIALMLIQAGLKEVRTAQAKLSGAPEPSCAPESMSAPENGRCFA
jgi:RsiW-degrading membrane proteinase PrsW (M82 family)